MKRTKTILSGTERGFFQGCIVILSLFILYLNYVGLVSNHWFQYSALATFIFALMIYGYVILLVGRSKSEVFKRVMILISILAVGYSIYSLFFPSIALTFFY